MDVLSIKIKIGDREYPMKVKVEDEVKIRQAGKLINEKLKKYREQFGIDDKQDLLAMVAFDCMIESMEQNFMNLEDSQKIESNITKVSDLLANLL
jgi:cell division protein ZapA (FtsZ GTPase activity inhibitor)